MKRKIAAALGVIMICSSYAAPFVQADDNTNSGSTTGSGSTAYVDESVLTVVVPTNKALDFTIDPQGLVALAEEDAGSNGEATKDDLKDYSGRILGNNALIFANKSIKDVTVTTKFKVTGDDKYLKADGKDVKQPNSTSSPNIQFLAVPTKDPIGITYATGEKAATSKDLKNINSSSAILTAFAGKAASKGIELSKTELEVKSVVPASNFKYSYDEDDGFSYELDDSKGNSATGFVIAGFCNPYATNYSSVDVGITASYSFEVATASESNSQAALTTSFAVISPKEDSAKWITTATNGVTTEIKTSQTSSVAAFEAGKTYSFDTTNGVKGSIADAVTLKSITFAYPRLNKTFDITSDCTIANGVVTIPASWANHAGELSTLKNDATAFDFTITTANSSGVSKSTAIKINFGS